MMTIMTMMTMMMMMNRGLRAVMWADNTNLPLPRPVVATLSHDDDDDDDHYDDHEYDEDQHDHDDDLGNTTQTYHNKIPPTTSTACGCHPAHMMMITMMTIM